MTMDRLDNSDPLIFYDAEISKIPEYYYNTWKQVGLEAFINLAKSSKLLDLTTPSFRNVDRWQRLLLHVEKSIIDRSSSDPPLPLPHEKFE